MFRERHTLRVQRLKPVLVATEHRIKSVNNGTLAHPARNIYQ